MNNCDLLAFVVIAYTFIDALFGANGTAVLTIVLAAACFAGMGVRLFRPRGKSKAA